MGQTRPPYTPEFRLQMVELHRSGRTIAELAREFEPAAVSISKWVKQADLVDGHFLLPEVWSLFLDPRRTAESCC